MIRQKLIEIIRGYDFKLPDIFFSLIRIKRFYKKPIIWLDMIVNENITELAQPINTISHAPILLNNEKKTYAESKIGIYLYKFENIVLNIESSSFLLLQSNSIIIERVVSAPLKYSNYTAGFVKFHNSYQALIRLNSKIISFKNIFFMGGNGSFNYYHWLIELAPKFLYITESEMIDNSIDVIVCETAVSNIASFQFILKTLMQYQKISTTVVYVDKQKNIYADKVFYINNFNNIVFNNKEKLSSVYYSQFHMESLTKLRHIFLNEVKQIKIEVSKIFLARKSCQVRSYNQDEVMSYFVQQGFKPVYLEEYSFIEQISLFHHADFIAGPSGAAWSNLIFCKESSQAISWLPEQLIEFSAFSSLAKIFKCDLKFIMTNSVSNAEDIHSDYEVDVNKLEYLYQKMSGYRV